MVNPTPNQRLVAVVKTRNLERVSKFVQKWHPQDVQGKALQCAIDLGRHDIAMYLTQYVPICDKDVKPRDPQRKHDDDDLVPQHKRFEQRTPRDYTMIQCLIKIWQSNNVSLRRAFDIMYREAIAIVVLKWLSIEFTCFTEINKAGYDISKLRPRIRCPGHSHPNEMIDAYAIAWHLYPPHPFEIPLFRIDEFLDLGADPSDIQTLESTQHIIERQWCKAYFVLWTIMPAVLVDLVHQYVDPKATVVHYFV